MACIRKHYGKWQVLIRKKFAKPITKTFVSKIAAEKYAREIESKIDQCILTTYDEAVKTTLRDLLERYRLEITAKKKCAEHCKFRHSARLNLVAVGTEDS